MNYKQEIDKAIQSFCEGWTAMDFNTFQDTVSWFAYDPLIAESWIKRMLKMIDDLEKTKLSKREVAALFPNMSEVRVKMGFDLWMAKYAGVSSDDGFKIGKFYVDLLTSYCYEDPYAFTKNIIHSKKEIDNLLYKVESADPKIARNLGRLVSGVYHLSHALYSDMYPSIVYDNYGPYDVSPKYGGGHIVAIKEFGHLKCPELWAETKNFPWIKINIVNVYKDIKMRVDSASHGIYEGDLINNLRYYYLEVDGQKFSIDEVDKISEASEQMAIRVFQIFQGLNIEERKVKYYHQKAYVYKGIYDYLGQDWRPSRAILDDAKDKPLYRTNWPRGNELRDLFRRVFDPFESFPKELPKA